MPIGCVAPLLTPPPVLNATLISIFLFTRHGARSPISQAGWPAPSGEWHCGGRYSQHTRIPVINGIPKSFAYNASQRHEFLPTCSEGSLLDDGFDQQVALGQLYRKYLTETNRLLPDSLDPTVIAVRASWVDRAQESALAFIEGFYPPQSDQETLDISTGNQSYDVLVPGFEAENGFRAIEEAFAALPDAEARINRSIGAYAGIFEHYNITVQNILEWLAIGDLFHTYYCGNNRLGDVVSDELLEQMLPDLAFLFHGLVKSKDRTYNPIRKYLLDEMDSFYSMEKKTKFSLLSGHDLTLMAVLSGIGHADVTLQPQYTAHLAVELWHLNRPMLRFVFNGEVVKVGGKDLIPLSEFKTNY
jgi:hypothetical protein